MGRAARFIFRFPLLDPPDSEARAQLSFPPKGCAWVKTGTAGQLQGWRCQNMALLWRRRDSDLILAVQVDRSIEGRF